MSLLRSMWETSTGTIWAMLRSKQQQLSKKLLRKLPSQLILFKAPIFWLDADLWSRTGFAFRSITSSVGVRSDGDSRTHNVVFGFEKFRRVCQVTISPPTSRASHLKNKTKQQQSKETANYSLFFTTGKHTTQQEVAAKLKILSKKYIDIDDWHFFKQKRQCNSLWWGNTH